MRKIDGLGLTHLLAMLDYPDKTRGLSLQPGAAERRARIRNVDPPGTDNADWTRVRTARDACPAHPAFAAAYPTEIRSIAARHHWPRWIGPLRPMTI